MGAGHFRFLLGIGEGGCFPGATKAATEWFPHRERALAIGIAIGGASLGGVAAAAPDGLAGRPGQLARSVRGHGIRGSHLGRGLVDPLPRARVVAVRHAGGAGPDRRSPETSPASRPLPAPAAPPPRLAELLARKDVWGLALVRFLVDPVFYFYMFWIPEVPQPGARAVAGGDRPVDLDSVLRPGRVQRPGRLGLRPTDRRRHAGRPARKLVMAGAALLTISSSAAAFAGSAAAAVAMMSLLMFAHGFWITNYVTRDQRGFPKNAVGTVMGLAGMVGTVGGMLANTIIGVVADRFSFLPIWIASGCLYPLALIVLLVTVGRPKMAALHD